MVNGFIADVSCLRQHPLPLNSIKWLKRKPLLRDWLVNQYNGKLIETGKDNLSYFISVFFTVFDGWIICDFTPFLPVFQSYQDVARPGIEPRTSDTSQMPYRLRYAVRLFSKMLHDGRAPGRYIMAALLQLKVYSFAKLVTNYIVMYMYLYQCRPICRRTCTCIFNSIQTS